MYMFKYVMKRLGLMLMTFIIIMIICFVLIKLLPNPTEASLGQDSFAIIAKMQARGYDLPIPVQMFRYVQRIIVDGDFGIGVTYADYRGKDVWSIFIEKLPPTVLINVYSSLLAVPLGILLGIYAALKKNKWQDQLISILVMVIISVPSFVYAFIIQYTICFKLNWFPKTMLSGFDYFTLPMFRSMFPAVLCLSFSSIAGYARGTRAELTEVLTSDFMLLARTKGLTKRQATVRHALKNAMVPIFPSIVGEFVAVLNGSLIIERIFSVPGVGNLYLDSITYQDYDFFMLLSGFYCLIGLTSAIVIDLSYGFIDPRIRMGAK